MPTQPKIIINSRREATARPEDADFTVGQHKAHRQGCHQEGRCHQILAMIKASGPARDSWQMERLKLSGPVRLRGWLQFEQ
jgi:hypothetical protein